MTRQVNTEILEKWAKGKKTPQLELAFKSEVSTGTVSRMFNGLCPATQKVRVKIASTIGVDEDELFPVVEEQNLAA